MPGMKSVVGMNEMGGARELAEMLRQMGRNGDTMLAHITPEEAQMLMDMGGAGTSNPQTGLPEFYDADIQGGENFYGEPVYEQEAGQFEPGGFYGETVAAPAPMDMTGFRQPSGFEPAPMPSGMRFDMNLPPPTQRIDITAPAMRQPFSLYERPALPEVPEQPGMLARGAQAVEDTAAQARALARQYPTVAKLLSTGVSSLPALLQAARARREGAAAAEQFRRLGEPLRTQGETLRQQALAGGLTPRQAQQLEAQRARLRQAGATRGVTTGTQAGMIEGQLARQRAATAETNLSNAIKMLNLANAYDEAAIKAKIASDQEIEASLANIFANLGRDITSQAPAQQPRQTAGLASQPEVTRRPDVRG